MIHAKPVTLRVTDASSEMIASIEKYRLQVTALADAAQKSAVNHIIRRTNEVYEGSLWPFVRPFLNLLGLDAIRSMSLEYATDPPLKAVVQRITGRFRDLLAVDLSIEVAIDRFAQDGAVRIMTIHKSKGLEFDSVVVLAVESDCFQGSLEEARAEFFVAI